MWLEKKLAWLKNVGTSESQELPRVLVFISSAGTLAAQGWRVRGRDQGNPHMTRYDSCKSIPELCPGETGLVECG